MHYIYKITIISNNKIYIGQTKDINTRWRQHKAEARKDNPSMTVNGAMKKYGIENCKIEIIDFAQNYWQADCLEQNYIKQLDSHISFGKGYNVSLGGPVAPKSEEWKEKVKATKAAWSPEKAEAISQQMSESAKQRIIEYPDSNPALYGIPFNELSEESKEKHRQSHIGHKASDETKQKMSEVRTGMTHSPGSHPSGKDHPMFGKHPTEETIAKMSEAHLGQIAWNKGKKMSAEAVENNRQAQIGLQSGEKNPMFGVHLQYLSDAQIQQMRTLRAEGMSYEKIAKKVGCNWKSVVKWTK